jgi:hypothetical protein
MRVRSFIQHQRGGVSVAIALLMALVVVVSLVQNIYMWNQSVSAEDRNRLKESLAIDHVYFNVNMDLVVNVRNTGSVDTHLVAVWIEPRTVVNETLRVGADAYMDVDHVQDIIIDATELSASIKITGTFIVTVFTERGTAVAQAYTFLAPSPVGNITQPLGHLGVFRVNWFYCRYSSSQNHPDPIEGPVVDVMRLNKSDDYVAFYLKVKNAWDHPCAIRADSFLALTSIAPPQGSGEPSFFLVDAVTYALGEDPTIAPYDEGVNQLFLYPNQTRMLIFACESPDEGGGQPENEAWRWGTGYPFGPETKTEGSGIQVSIFFEVYDFDDEAKQWVASGRYFGQTISTQAMLLGAK